MVLWPDDHDPADVTVFQAGTWWRHAVERDLSMNGVEVRHKNCRAQVGLGALFGYPSKGPGCFAEVGVSVENRGNQHSIHGVIRLVSAHVGWRPCHHHGCVWVWV